MSEGIYGIMVVGGPIVLALVILWAMLRNRTSKRQEAETEAATRRMYEQQNRDDQARDNA